MALPAPPRLAPAPDAGQFQGPGASTAPSVDPSAGASPAPAVTDPGAAEDANNLGNIVSAARILGLKYPSAIPYVQTITSAVQDIQNAITQVAPPAEMAAPPQ